MMLTRQRPIWPTLSAMATDDDVPPVSGWAFIAFGVIVAAIGWLVLSFPEDAPPEALGVALIAVGSLLSTIGSIAVGVTMGFARADWRRQSVRR